MPAPPAAPSEAVATAARDELSLPVHRAYKNVADGVTEEDRATRCIRGWEVLWDRSTEQLQESIARRPHAAQYYTDDVAPYPRRVSDPGHQAAAPGKSPTSSVEADKAALRHDLARLARNSRCFSRALEALRRAVTLFVHAWTRRQLHKGAFNAG